MTLYSRKSSDEYIINTEIKFLDKLSRRATTGKGAKCPAYREVPVLLKVEGP